MFDSKTPGQVNPQYPRISRTGLTGDYIFAATHQAKYVRIAIWRQPKR